MRRSGTLKYFLAVSLLLNLSFIGSAAYTHYAKSSYRLGQSAHAPCPVRSTHLYEQLSLKPEQVKLFQQKAEVFHASLASRRQEIDRLRQSLIDQMASDQPDNEAITAAIGQINRIQGEMQKAVVSHMLEFKSMLSKDQQKKFLRMVEGAMSIHGEAACP